MSWKSIVRDGVAICPCVYCGQEFTDTAACMQHVALCPKGAKWRPPLWENPLRRDEVCTRIQNPA